MRQERQIALLRQVAEAGPSLKGLHAPQSRWQSTQSYSDPARFALERSRLFRQGVVFFGLSADLANPGDYRALRVGGIPLLVVRQADGTLQALVNACRHRGAPLVEPFSTGNLRSTLACPYHAWTYELNGTLRARPGDSGAFDDVAENCNLLSRPVAEAHGLIFLRPEGQAPIDLAETLGGIGDDLGAFKLDSYVHIDTRVHDWDINWKLFFDTFSESYHIRSLHRSSIAPTFNSDCSIFEAFGKNLLSVGLRNNVFDEFAKPEAEWSLLPYGTIQYFLMPNGLVVHQLDHFEVWVVEPIGVNQTRTTTSVYAPRAPATEKARNYFVKNLDLLLSVTGGEDFALMAEIQRTLDAGALPEFLYGRIEPALLHFHAQLDRLLEQDPPAP